MINNIPPVKTSIFYINDLHGRLGSMERISAMSNTFDNSRTDADRLKLASGDIMIGADEKSNTCANDFLNSVGITSTALGNHEFDQNPDVLARITQKAKFKLLGINLSVAQNNPLYTKIEKSYVEEKNGHKYGIIGIAPPDLHERIRGNASREQVMVDDFDKTIKDVQAEADKFKAQGINKIIVLSHSGLDKDRRLAKETSGIDVILGGHTHELLSGVNENENLIYSKNNEPVVITQAGKDGEYAGVLNLEFDPNGVITKAQNSVTSSDKFKRSRPLIKVFEMVLGKPEHIGEVKYAAPPPVHRLVDPNPHANFIMDATRSELGTDLALINAGGVRGYFEQGPLDSRQVFEVAPLKNNTVVLKLTEKEIVDALKNGAKSYLSPVFKPSVVIPSGLKYTVSRKGEIKAVSFIDKQGKEIPIDVNNPNPNKVYTVATNDFFASGGDNLISNKLAAGQYDKKYDFDVDKLTCDYIKKLHQPIEIRDDGRMTVVDEPVSFTGGRQEVAKALQEQGYPIYFKTVLKTWGKYGFETHTKRIAAAKARGIEINSDRDAMELLKLAEEIGIAKACKKLGYGLSSYHRYKKEYDETGFVIVNKIRSEKGRLKSSTHSAPVSSDTP